MSITTWFEAMSLKAGHCIKHDNVRFVGRQDNYQDFEHVRLYYQHGNSISYEYCLADMIITKLSVEQILSDSIIFKMNEKHVLTIEEIGNAVFNKI